MYNKFYSIETCDKSGRWLTRTNNYSDIEYAETIASELNDSGNYEEVRIMRTMIDIMFNINSITGKVYRKKEQQNEYIRT